MPSVTLHKAGVRSRLADDEVPNAGKYWRKSGIGKNSGRSHVSNPGSVEHSFY